MSSCESRNFSIEKVEKRNWEKLKLIVVKHIRKLIATHFDPNKPTYKLELSGDRTGDGKITTMDVVKTPLKGNGDFRSPECLDLLDECDIVVTNPPFSLMKEYLSTLVKSGKRFLVLGNTNHITYKELFPYFMDGACWLGYNAGHFWFKVPDYYEPKRTDYKEDESGQKWRRLGNICWFTNMDIDRRHQPLDLFKRYSSEAYPTYDEYDAINCNLNSDIPCDTDKVIGVPISYMAYHCPEQFEIVGHLGSYPPDGYSLCSSIHIDGRKVYKRIAIRRKETAEDGVEYEDRT